MLFGGILTKYAGWEWIFFVNVPVGALVLALTRPLVRESRIPGLRGFDFAGAATITGSLALLVYGISKAPDVGWSSGRTIGFPTANLGLGAIQLGLVFTGWGALVGGISLTILVWIAAYAIGGGR